MTGSRASEALAVDAPSLGPSSGEGAASALAKMQHQERHRSGERGGDPRVSREGGDAGTPDTPSDSPGLAPSRE